jgi:hypothetical protein
MPTPSCVDLHARLGVSSPYQLPTPPAIGRYPAGVKEILRMKSAATLTVQQQPRPLATLAAEINHHHRQAEAALRSGLEHALEAGRLLIEAKSRCVHGTWGLWLADNFEGSARTAQAYMRVADRWPELQAKAQDSADLSLDGALKLLAAPREFRLEGIEPNANLPEVKRLRAEFDELTSPPVSDEDFRRACEILNSMMDIANDMSIWRLNIARQAGQLLNGLEQDFGKDFVKLLCKEIGIRGRERCLWQVAAQVPQEDYYDWATELRGKHDEVTLQGLVNLVRSGIVKVAPPECQYAGAVG